MMKDLTKEENMAHTCNQNVLIFIKNMLIY